MIVVSVVIMITSWVSADITVGVYEVDGNTPFDDRDIMIGEKLTIVVSSDTNDFWSGGLFTSGNHRLRATLSGRDNDPNTRDCELSHYEAAGDIAKVTGWQDSSIWGFDLYTSDINDSNFIAGNWFIIDYEAEAIGDCNVGFYDYNTSWSDPNYYLYFYHIPTRDIKPDGVVDFLDFSILAPQWFAIDCNEPNWCQGADFDMDGDVDINDLGLFMDYWLWPNEGDEPAEPNEPNYPLDPTIIYSIVDANDSNEITIDVNDTITLYVKLDTTDSNNVSNFWIEVNISDVNLGSIDNTPIDSNNPPPTAEILSEPNRWDTFDNFGPGDNQEEGIVLAGYHVDVAINDGNMASFEFTCLGQGDVTLTLINVDSSNTDSNSVYPTLENILIHQNGQGGAPLGGGGGDGGGEESMMMAEAEAEPEPNVAELADFLEEIWNDESAQIDSTEKEWDTFVESVRNSE